MSETSIRNMVAAIFAAEETRLLFVLLQIVPFVLFPFFVLLSISPYLISECLFYCFVFCSAFLKVVVLFVCLFVWFLHSIFIHIVTIIVPELMYKILLRQTRLLRHGTGPAASRSSCYSFRQRVIALPKSSPVSRSTATVQNRRGFCSICSTFVLNTCRLVFCCCEFACHSPPFSSLRFFVSLLSPFTLKCLKCSKHPTFFVLYASIFPVSSSLVSFIILLRRPFRSLYGRFVFAFTTSCAAVSSLCVLLYFASFSIILNIKFVT